MRYKLFFQKSYSLLVLLLCLAGCTSEWTRYVNKEHKLSILLPASWEKEEGAFKTVIIALAPLDTTKPKLSRVRTNINVIASELPTPVDVSTLFELNKTELGTKLARMDEFLEGDIYAGTLRGKWLSFEGLLREARVKIISGIWVKDRRVYSVTCTARTDEFAKYDPLFQKVLRSLRVK
ncbi:MAG: hypothetical protein WC532_08820 [Candidatus Omnitrophota bacterium]